MNTTTKIAPATVTKALKAAGFEKAQWRKPGVSTWNDGFLTESANYLNAVDVVWLPAGVHRCYTEAERDARALKYATMIAALINAGFQTEFHAPGEIEDAYIRVRKAA